MIVYVDLLIISTFLVTFLFLKTISILNQSPSNLLRLIIGTLISCFSILLFFLPWNIFFIIRYFVGIIIVFVSFPYINIKQRILEIVLFYLMHFLFIGILQIVKLDNLKIVEYLIGIVITIILIMILNIKTKKNNDDTLYIKLEGKYFLSLVDNGNTASFNDVPIVFVPSHIKKDKYKLVGVVKISTISKSDYHNVYSGPKIKVFSKVYKVYYIFSSVLEKEIILNRRMKDD
ncbi:MAG: sigma-E processing peptidase SpoIIGA [Bacilli bacterium]|nr:sigma-E processing peptidase SpoIIGA [Bacilli bacterium]